MNLTYKKSPNKAPKNVWIVKLEWMSGDADHNDYTDHTFNSEAECVTFIAKIQEIINFTNKYWNLVCDLESNGHLNEKQFVEDGLKWVNAGERDKKRVYNQELWNIIKTLIGDAPCWRDYLEKLVGSIPYDVTTDGDSHAKLRGIESIVKYDENGTKFEVEVS